MDPAADAIEQPEHEEIITDRLRLRTLRLTDAEALLSILLSREEVMRWTTAGPMNSVAQAERWLLDRTGVNTFNFAIELRDNSSTTPRIIGVGGSFIPPQIGYMTQPEYTGKGYATEALTALIPRVFAWMPDAKHGGVDYLEGWTDGQNLASQRILQKCGFVLCETRPDPQNAQRGDSSIKIFRLARPGTSLREVGLAPGDGPNEKAPTPPVQ